MTKRPIPLWLVALVAFLFGGLVPVVPLAWQSVTDDNQRPSPFSATQAPLPSDVLDLSNWKLQVEGRDIKQPDLDQYQSERFGVRDQGDSVRFKAFVGDRTTPNSSYPRSELREMKGSAHASWSSTSGVHVLHMDQAIMKTPVKKPHVVAGQVHDSEDDVLMVRLEGTRLFVESGGEEIGLLTNNYTIGTRFNVRIEVANGLYGVRYNGQIVARLKRAVSGNYFKAGAYTQSNPSKGDSPSAFGQVLIFKLNVIHK